MQVQRCGLIGLLRPKSKRNALLSNVVCTYYDVLTQLYIPVTVNPSMVIYNSNAAIDCGSGQLGSSDCYPPITSVAAVTAILAFRATGKWFTWNFFSITPVHIYHYLYVVI